MRIVTNENNVITAILYAAHIDGSIEIKGDIPENIEPMKWCYTAERGFYENPDYTALIEKANAAVSLTEKASLLHEAEEKLLADMPVIPIIFNEDAYLISKDLSGIKSTYYGTRIFNRTQQKNWEAYVPEE